MNGRRVLNQLIKLFIVVNIVLLVIGIACKSNRYIVSQERIENITKLYEESGINIETELPKNFAPKYSASLTFKSNGVEIRDRVVKRFFANNLVDVKRSTEESAESGENVLCYMLGNETLSFKENEVIYTNNTDRENAVRSSLQKAKNECLQLMKRIEDTKKQPVYFVLEEAEDTYWRLTYYPVIEGMPVMDSSMCFIVDDIGVKTAHIYLAELAIDDEAKQEIYPIDLVLFGIKEYLLQCNYTAIESIQMCYKRLENEENILGQQIVPMYKIKISGLEEALFVNAYTNERVK